MSHMVPSSCLLKAGLEDARFQALMVGCKALHQTFGLCTDLTKSVEGFKFGNRMSGLEKSIGQLHVEIRDALEATQTMADKTSKIVSPLHRASDELCRVLNARKTKRHLPADRYLEMHKQYDIHALQLVMQDLDNLIQMWAGIKTKLRHVLTTVNEQGGAMGIVVEEARSRLEKQQAARDSLNEQCDNLKKELQDAKQQVVQITTESNRINENFHAGMSRHHEGVKRMDALYGSQRLAHEASMEEHRQRESRANVQELAVRHAKKDDELKQFELQTQSAHTIQSDQIAKQQMVFADLEVDVQKVESKWKMEAVEAKATEAAGELAGKALQTLNTVSGGLFHNCVLVFQSAASEVFLGEISITDSKEQMVQMKAELEKNIEAQKASRLAAEKGKLDLQEKIGQARVDFEKELALKLDRANSMLDQKSSKFMSDLQGRQNAEMKAMLKNKAEVEAEHAAKVAAIGKNLTQWEENVLQKDRELKATLAQLTTAECSHLAAQEEHDSAWSNLKDQKNIAKGVQEDLNKADMMLNHLEKLRTQVDQIHMTARHMREPLQNVSDSLMDIHRYVIREQRSKPVCNYPGAQATEVSTTVFHVEPCELDMAIKHAEALRTALSELSTGLKNMNANVKSCEQTMSDYEQKK